jgi:DNA-binding LytR/AlgR family response regulator
MKVLIVEDEKRSALRLKKLMLNHPKANNFNIAFAESVYEAEKIVSNEVFDLLFLDLQLNNEDGFDLLRNVVSQSYQTIIVSAYTERAIEAYEYGVLDFIPKPVFQERLNKSIDRIFSTARLNNQTKSLYIKSRNSVEAIEVDKIIYLKSVDRYSELNLDHGSKKIHNLSLDKIIKILPMNFERIHRSIILNLNYFKKIYSFPGSKYEVELNDGNRLPIGRKYIKKIRDITQ